MAKKYYAVKRGHKTGVFMSWNECSKQVHGYSGAVYRAFDEEDEANRYLNNQEVSMSKRYETEEEVLSTLEEDEMIAYVDGSNLGDGLAFSWGVVAFSKRLTPQKKTLNGKSTDEKFTKYRNVSGELFAAVHAVNFAIESGMRKIIICHDYSGIRHWALGEWKTRNVLSKSYKRYFEKVERQIEVEFVKADGHTGDKFNEEADILAKKALGIDK